MNSRVLLVLFLSSLSFLKLSAQSGWVYLEDEILPWVWNADSEQWAYWPSMPASVIVQDGDGWAEQELYSLGVADSMGQLYQSLRLYSPDIAEEPMYIFLFNYSGRADGDFYIGSELHQVDYKRVTDADRNVAYVYLVWDEGAVSIVLNFDNTGGGRYVLMGEFAARSSCQLCVEEGRFVIEPFPVTF